MKTDDGEDIPAKYSEYLDVFAKKGTETLPPHDEKRDHAIDIEPGTNTLPHCRICKLSELELATLKAYIKTNLDKGFIQRSSSPAAAPILFVKKKDGGLRLCVDYRALNAVTIKNRYPLPLISEILDRVRNAKIYTKLDLRDAYHLIRIREGDEYKTAFRTRYGQFEFRVMPFCLTNAPSTFQSYINECLRPFLDDFTICYLDDILIYSNTPEEHEQHVKKVLACLREFGLYCKAAKCEFGVKKVGFLGFVITPDGVGMEGDRVASIEDWPTPTSVKDVQVFLGFTNCYRRFIRKYAKVTTPISNLLRKTEGKWEWTRDADRGFQKLKRLFSDAPLMQHFDPQKPIIFHRDASGYAIAGILNQYDGFGTLHPVSFYSRKCTPAEQNYDTYDRELLAIVESFRNWRHYLEGAKYPILVRCDHKNLEYFTTTKMLSRRQARWSETLSSYDFKVEHLEGKKNPADGPSRRPDYEVDYSRPVTNLLATLAACHTDQQDDFLPAIRAGQKKDKLAQDTIASIASTSDLDTKWKMALDLLAWEGRIYVPDVDSLRTRVISRYHDNPESGHFGALRTLELLSREFFWPNMELTVRKYVKGCEVCHRVKAPRHAKYGPNLSILIPDRPWQGLTMDFVTDLPKSTACDYMSIAVIIDRLTKYAIYLPCRKDLDSPELAKMFFEHVMCKHGIPDHIITDRGTQFTSRFWKRVCSYLTVDHRLSTAFHPQTDGQTERQNQTMEQYLRGIHQL